MSDYLFGMPGWCLEWHFANVLLLQCVPYTNDWKVNLYVYQGALHREHAAVKWSYKGYNEPFILDFRSLVFISSLQKHMILKYMENNETKLLLKRHDLTLPKCLKSYIVEKWVVIFLSWFPFRGIWQKSQINTLELLEFISYKKYFGKKIFFEILEK